MEHVSVFRPETLYQKDGLYLIHYKRHSTLKRIWNFTASFNCGHHTCPVAVLYPVVCTLHPSSVRLLRKVSFTVEILVNLSGKSGTFLIDYIKCINVRSLDIRVVTL